MTFTSSIVGVDTTPTTVSVQRLNPSNISLTGTTVDVKSGVSQATYKIVTGDSRYPLQLMLRVQTQGTVRRCSARIQSYVKVDDSVTGVSEYYPIDSLVAFNLPDALIDLADVATLICNAYGVLLGTVAAGTPDYAVVSNLMFGVPKI